MMVDEVRRITIDGGGYEEGAPVSVHSRRRIREKARGRREAAA
jgi:hypothetical protein